MAAAPRILRAETFDDVQEFPVSEFAVSEGENRINDEIDARLVRLIGSDGTQHGVLSVPDALQIARSEGLDLVEVARTTDAPPVCKIMDYKTWRRQQDHRRRG